MKQNIMDIEERLTLLPINEVEAVSRFASEYAELANLRLTARQRKSIGELGHL